MSTHCILLPHIKIHNANALSSPFTIGFPAMTAWLGFVHALQRKLNAKHIPVRFSGVGVVSHHFDLQTYKGVGDFDFSIIGTGNPLEPKSEKDKPKGNAVRPSFIEEARCHLEVSLVIEFDGIEAHELKPLLESMHQCVMGRMKIAGGDILSCRMPEPADPQNCFKRLMPGYALIERRDLMMQAMENGQDALDAMLDYLKTRHRCKKVYKNEKESIEWVASRKPVSANGKSGWIVPIATGFQGISPISNAKNQRDMDSPHRFAESIVTLGEFKMVYRLSSFDEILWRYQFDSENDLYRCVQ